MTHQRFVILKIAILGLSLSFAGLALAQEKFPSRPVTIVVPQAAGGANDAIARVVAQKLSEQWGQTVLVENRPGAGGNVGTAFAAKAKNDGYTLLVNADSAQVINPALYSLDSRMCPAAGADVIIQCRNIPDPKPDHRKCFFLKDGNSEFTFLSGFKRLSRLGIDNFDKGNV
jgi:hypothetical protein